MADYFSFECFTNEEGPEVFQPCAKAWAHPKWTQKDITGRYLNANVQPKDVPCERGNPPNNENLLCKNYFKKIKKLR